jgi:RNA recognition motif-containing protein
MSSIPRGPPKKPKQSGHALWCGNLPAQTHIMELKDYFSREATDDIESVFLISKSNCAFINYKSEGSCAAALTRFHDSRFQGAKLVCRLRKGPAATPAGAPTGPRTDSISAGPSQPLDAVHDHAEVPTTQKEPTKTTISGERAGEKFFVMKSLTVKDLDASLRSGSWATQSHNEDVLKAAYEVSVCQPTFVP